MTHLYVLDNLDGHIEGDWNKRGVQRDHGKEVEGAGQPPSVNVKLRVK